MSETGTFLTVDELIARQDERDLLALCGIGGPNSAAGRVIDRDRLDAQIKRAQSFASGYVQSRYPALRLMVPADVPEALKGAIETLVLYWLRDRVAGQSAVSDEWRDRYRDIVAWLRDIHAGRADLDLPAPTGLEDQGEMSIQFSFPASRADDVLGGYND